jgi:hypothetical protein
MFPGESNFTFICNQEHLAEPAYRMGAILPCLKSRRVEIH